MTISKSLICIPCLFIGVGVDFATAGEDFRELVDVPVVVEPGGLFPNVSITIINDLITEFPEQLQYIIRTEMPRVVIFGTQTFSILDDDCKSIHFCHCGEPY